MRAVADRSTAYMMMPVSREGRRPGAGVSGGMGGWGGGGEPGRS